MNCVAIALFRAGSEPAIAAADDARITRVIEYFFPRGELTRIWVDVFVDNPTNDKLILKILHAGRLTAENVTADSWVTPDFTTSNFGSASAQNHRNESCEAVLTMRTLRLHHDYHPINVDQQNSTIILDGKEYWAWTEKLGEQEMGSGSSHAPFSMWEVGPIESNTGTAFRLRLEMSKKTFQDRLAGKNSFFAYGEAIVLANVAEDIERKTGDSGYDYASEFQSFILGHRPPEAFEYLVVARDGEILGWDAVPLSPLISARFIESDDLANTTRWFATDSPYIATWKLRADRKNAFMLRVRSHRGKRIQPKDAPRREDNPVYKAGEKAHTSLSS